MMRQRHRASGTAYNVAALLTADLAGISPAIEENDRLAILVINPIQRLQESIADGRCVTKTKLLSHIDYNSRGKLSAAVSLAKRDQGICTTLCLVKALHRRSSRGKEQKCVMLTTSVRRYIAGVIFW